LVVTHCGYPFPVRTLLEYTEDQVTLLKRVANQDASVYTTDIRALLRLAIFWHKDVTIPDVVPDALQTHFERKVRVMAIDSAHWETREACRILFDWINNTAATTIHAYAAVYIRECYTRGRYTPPVPDVFNFIFEVKAEGDLPRKRALLYYHYVWRVSTNINLNRAIFLLTCRAYSLRGRLKALDRLRGNKLDTNLNANLTKEWKHLRTYESFFDALVEFHRRIQTEYVTVQCRPRSSPSGKRATQLNRIKLEVADHLIGYYKKTDQLLDAFCSWSPSTGNSVWLPVTETCKYSNNFCKELLWAIAEMPADALEATENFSLMISRREGQ